MKYNLHAHTYRCSHASGTAEEYVLRAIEGGIECFGFSDHMPYINPNGREDKFRVPVAEADGYISEILSLKEKYKDKIDIHVGFETEYYADHFDGMLEHAHSLGAEYLILGQHFWAPYSEDRLPSSTPTSDVDRLDEYVSSVVSAIRSGAFTYVAHPDLFNFTGSDDEYAEYMRRICVASRECGVPLEINFLGIREGRIYPSDRFFRIAAEERSPITFGFDSHSVDAAYDAESMAVAYDMVDRLSLNYIGMPKIVNISKRG